MGDAALVHGDFCASLLNNPISTGQPWVVFSWGLVVGLVSFVGCIPLSSSMGSFTAFSSFLWAPEGCRVRDLAQMRERSQQKEDENWLCGPTVF